MSSSTHTDGKASTNRKAKTQKRAREEAIVQTGQDLIIVDDDVSTSNFIKSRAKQDSQAEKDNIIEDHEQTMKDIVDGSEQALFSELASCFDEISDDDFEVF